MTLPDDRGMNPLDWVRAHAVSLGLDAEGMATAAQAQIDQAEAWQGQATRNVDNVCDVCGCYWDTPQHYYGRPVAADELTRLTQEQLGSDE